MLIGTTFMFCMAILFLTIPKWIVRRVHTGPDGDRGGEHAAFRGGVFLVIRWNANRGDGRAERSGRYADADVVPSNLLLGDRPAVGCVLVFPGRIRGRGIVAGLSVALILIGSTLLYSGGARNARSRAEKWK